MKECEYTGNVPAHGCSVRRGGTVQPSSAQLSEALSQMGAASRPWVHAHPVDAIEPARERNHGSAQGHEGNLFVDAFAARVEVLARGAYSISLQPMPTPSRKRSVNGFSTNDD